MNPTDTLEKAIVKAINDFYIETGLKVSEIRPFWPNTMSVSQCTSAEVFAASSRPS